MSFWTNFDRICKEKGTNPTALIVKKMGLSPSKVTMWKGGSLPKEEMLERLAAELGCKVSDFFTDDTGVARVTIDVGGSSTEMSNRLSSEEDYIVKLLRSCNVGDRHTFMDNAMKFDRSRGLGVLDRITAQRKNTGTAKFGMNIEPLATVIVPKDVDLPKGTLMGSYKALTGTESDVFIKEAPVAVVPEGSVHIYRTFKAKPKKSFLKAKGEQSITR